jgi:nicotinamidase-related amidase
MNAEDMKTVNPALILIDIQKGFDEIDFWGEHRNNPDAEKNAGLLLTFWREMNLPVFHIKHCSQNPESKLAEGQPGNDFKDETAPLNGEPVILKRVNSAFIGTSLQELLDRNDIKVIVLVGFTTDHCVSTTARMAANLGYKTIVVEDATATFNRKGGKGEDFSAETVHATSLASLNGEFAKVIDTSHCIRLIKNILKGTEIIF